MIHKRKKNSTLTICGKPLSTIEHVGLWKKVTCPDCINNRPFKENDKYIRKGLPNGYAPKVVNVTPPMKLEDVDINKLRKFFKDLPTRDC